MLKDPTIAIRDCVTEIAILHEIEARTTLYTFRNDPIVRRAAAYAIQTISEAVRRIPDDWLADFPTEPWGQIRGIGSRIRHEYFRVDDAILWEIIIPLRLENPKIGRIDDAEIVSDRIAEDGPVFRHLLA